MIITTNSITNFLAATHSHSTIYYLIVIQLKLKVGDQAECTYADLMALKATIETFQMVNDEVIPTLLEYQNNEIEGISRRSWLTENVVCNLSSSALGILNSFNLYGRTYSQDNC